VLACLREYVLFSRLGRTDSSFTNLHDAGRLDVVYECAVSALFLSHAIRRDTVLHVVLNGPPNPPLHVTIMGSSLYDVRTDQDTWTKILRKILSGKQHPGISMDRSSFETLLKTKANTSQVYVLEEKGQDVSNLRLGKNSVFVLGDHVGLPKKAEVYALRYGRKISLGKRPYLAASCITVLNYILDKGQDCQT